MSFRCELCGSPSEGKPTRVVVERRQRVYPPREKANPKREIYRLIWKSPEWPPWAKGRWAVEKSTSSEDDPGGTGWEIAKEADACVSCKDALDNPLEETFRLLAEASMRAQAEFLMGLSA